MNKYAKDSPLAPRLLLHDQYDNVFKAIISAGWNVKSDGDIESVTGFYALVEIPAHLGEMAEMLDAVDLNDDEVWPDPGWYVTTEDSAGLIWVYEFSSETGAERRYDYLTDEYLDWAEQGDER